MKRLSALLAALLSMTILCIPPAFAAESAAAPAAQTVSDTYTQSGKGSATLENVAINTHLAAAHFTHAGSSAFMVKQTKPDGTELVLVNAIGNYDATVPMDTVSPSKLQITADGNWTVALNPGVYWGETGLKYHIDPKCMSFQETTPKLGTVTEARQVGRIGWCLICSDGMGRWNASYAGAPASVRSVGQAAASTPAAAPASSVAASQPPAQSVGSQIYRTKTGKKYHYENPCGRGTYYPCTLEEALAAGLGPCDKCVN